MGGLYAVAVGRLTRVRSFGECGLVPGIRLGTLELGELASRVEAAAGQLADIVLVDDAPPGLAYRIFRDGRVLVVKGRAALVRRKARAALEYLDFKPFEDLCANGVLAAAAPGR